MKNLKILLVRHGESRANTEMYISGSLNTLLSSKGIRQANDLGFNFWLKKVDIDAVYSSNLARAEETAERIRIFQYKRVELDENSKENELAKLFLVKKSSKLNEMSFGTIEGVDYKYLPKYVSKEWDKYGYPISVPEQENPKDVLKRAVEGISEIAEKEKGSNRICIVTHGMLLRILLEEYKGKIFDIINNAEYIEIEYNYDTKELIFN